MAMNHLIDSLSTGSNNIVIDDTFSLDSEVARQFIQERSDIAKLLSLMAHNQTYMELLDQLIVKVDAAVVHNRNAQSFIKSKLFSQKNAVVTRRQPSTTLQCWPPYFKDVNGMVPPQNQETVEIARICATNTLMEEDRKWKDKELDLLRNSIAQSLKECQITSLDSKMAIICAKLRTAGVEVTEEQLENWRGERDRIRHRITYIRGRPVEEILQEANGDFSQVDWAKISATNFQGSRSINQLQQKWCNDMVYNQEPWTVEEDARLLELAADCSNWGTIAQLLNTGRSAFRCFERHSYLKQSQKLPIAWTPEEDQKLLHYVQLLKIGEEIPWGKIALYMEGRSKYACEYRYTRSLNEKIRHGRWTHSEDMRLLCAVNKYGPHSWAKIAELVGDRSALQCRDRWVNVLDSKRRSLPWGWEEQQRLFYGVRLFGREQCAKIAKLIPGRNDMDVRMRMRHLVKYKIEETTRPNKKLVFRNVANNYTFCKMRRKHVLEKFKKLLETESGGDQNSQLAARLGFGSFVAMPETGLGLDYSNVRKERSEEFGNWRIVGDGRWVRVLQKNPNEYDRDDLMDELDKLPEEVQNEAIEWIRNSDRRLKREQEQEAEIPADDPVEEKDFYAKMYTEERIKELSETVGELMPPRPCDLEYYKRYSKRPPKIRLKHVTGMTKKELKKGKKKGRKQRKSKKLTGKVNEADLSKMRWSDRMMLEVNNYLNQLPKNDRRGYLITSLCDSIRKRVHYSNTLRFKSEPGFKDKMFTAMYNYVAQVLDDPPAPIPIKPAVALAEERENTVVLPPNWQHLSLKEMMQFKISPSIYPALVQQLNSNNRQTEQQKVDDDQQMMSMMPIAGRTRKRRRLSENPEQRFKHTVICPLPVADEQRQRRAMEAAHCATQQKIMAKLLPPSVATTNAVEFYYLKIHKQLMRESSLFAAHNDGSMVPGTSSAERSNEPQNQLQQQRYTVPQEIRESPEYALLKKRIFRLFFLPMMLRRAVSHNVETNTK